MDHHDDDEFPRQLHELHRQHCRDYPHRPMKYEPALIARIVGYIWARRLHGETLEDCSRKLGISVGRLRGWLIRVSRRSRPPVPSVPAPGRPLLRPVQVAAETVRVPDGVREKRYILISPAGYVVRGLRLPELIELLRGLT